MRRYAAGRCAGASVASRVATPVLRGCIDTINRPGWMLNGVSSLARTDADFIHLTEEILRS